MAHPSFEDDWAPIPHTSYDGHWEWTPTHHTKWTLGIDTHKPTNEDWALTPPPHHTRHSSE